MLAPQPLVGGNGHQQPRAGRRDAPQLGQRATSSRSTCSSTSVARMRSKLASANGSASMLRLGARRRARGDRQNAIACGRGIDARGRCRGARTRPGCGRFRSPRRGCAARPARRPGAAATTGRRGGPGTTSGRPRARRAAGRRGPPSRADRMLSRRRAPRETPGARRRAPLRGSRRSWWSLRLSSRATRCRRPTTCGARRRGRALRPDGVRPFGSNPRAGRLGRRVPAVHAVRPRTGCRTSRCGTRT